MTLASIPEAFEIIREGGVVAVPTEAVYGLSCDPWNETAVRTLLELKQRDVAQGLILVAGGLYQFTSLVEHLPREQQQTLLASWPGPVTWLVPATEHVPAWIRGEHATVALRVTAHPVMAELCRVAGKPLVSTSANPSGKPPARDPAMLAGYFPGLPIVEGELGGAQRPSEIRDLESGKILRPS
ncbi:MAG: Sua5/YciO/YrdC/YwlC family protein [Proteobacteria bacterium]|nr:Sua5/YciO/YrdC/YwlC family protein [Pseudomonadota bacterium]